MSLANSLQTVLNQLVISDKDREPYTKDAVAIANAIMDSLKKADPTFRQAFDGLSLSGSYLDRTKLLTPDEFDLHMKLKFPFTITPIRDNSRAGFVFLSASNALYINPVVVGNDYVSRNKMQDWLRRVFRDALARDIRIDGNLYHLSYEGQGYGCAHTIVAKSDSRLISFDFVPVFEYDYSSWPLLHPPGVSQEVRQDWPWFAVPQQKSPNDERTFMVCAPHWEREMMKGNNNLKNVLRLMKAMRDVYSHDMPHLSSYMLKTVIILEIDNYKWNQNLATLLLAMWKRLVYRLQTENLPFFLANDCNHFDRLNRKDLLKCKATAEMLLRKLNALQYNSNYNEVSKHFLSN